MSPVTGLTYFLGSGPASEAALSRLIPLACRLKNQCSGLFAPSPHSGWARVPRDRRFPCCPDDRPPILRAPRAPHPGRPRPGALQSAGRRPQSACSLCVAQSAVCRGKIASARQAAAALAPTHRMRLIHPTAALPAGAKAHRNRNHGRNTPPFESHSSPV